MKLVQKLLFVTATTFFVAQGCNKDNALNQSEIGTTEELVVGKPAEGARFCASHEHNAALMAAEPAFKAQQARIEDFTTRFVSLNPALQTRAVVTIPVVVHVVYKTAAENVSDAQIQSQIDILNADFRKLNADVTKVPAAFQSLVADCEIQFCLAKRTPTGAPTTGIERKATTKRSFSYSTNGVKSVASGGLAAWDATQYLNLWVCTLSNSTLGYAQFPGGALATDGVVILNRAFGSTGTAAAPFNKGRTATHEVGHWLNLRHIWGDDSGACTGSDQVADTPNQGAENYGCPAATKASCSNGGDMHMNYMDYTDDACMYMFSAGQKARMQANLVAGGARYSITQSGKCNP